MQVLPLQLGLVPFGQLALVPFGQLALAPFGWMPEAQLLVVATVAEPFVDHAPLVIEIAGKICPWTCLPRAVLVEESHLSSSFL